MINSYFFGRHYLVKNGVRNCFSARNKRAYHASTGVLSGLPASVFGLVEVREKEEEEQTVQRDPHHKTLGIVAFCEEQLELVSEDCYKLHLKDTAIDQKIFCRC